MAFEDQGPATLNLSFVAAADLSAAQFKFVKLDSNGKIVVCDTDGEVALGVLQDTPKSGQAGNVCLYGITKILIAQSEVIGAGSAVGTSTAGTATKTDSTVTGADIGDMMMGILLEAATGSNPAKVLGSMLLRPMGRVAT